MGTLQFGTAVRQRFDSIPAVLQLGLALLGTLVLLWGLFGLVVVLPSMPRSESGFAEGVAFILYGLYFLGGSVILALGLLIPQRDDSGVQFTRRQRRVLFYGVLAPVAGVVAIPLAIQFAPAALESVQPALLLGLLLFALTGPLATLVVLASKLRSWRRSDISE